MVGGVEHHIKARIRQSQGVANRMVGGMARITIGLNEAGRAVVKDYGVEPLISPTILFPWPEPPAFGIFLHKKI